MLDLLCLLALTPATVGPSAHDTIDAPVLARIGEFDGPGPDVFGRIEALALGSDGTIYVLDGQSHEVRRFDAGGRHLGSIGGRGEGPGEFLAPVGLAWSPEGELWVIDPENQRATVFAPDGALVTSHALPSGFTLSPWPGRFDTEGRLYHYAESAAGEYRFEMVRYGPALAPEATLSPPRPERAESFFEGRTARGSHLRARVPFTPRHVWRLSSRGEFWSMWTGELRIRRHRRGGGTEDVVVRDAAGPDVTPADRRRAIEDLARFRELGGRLDPDRIPDVKPPVKTFFLDDADRIWVLLTPRAGSDGSVLEVFTPEGTHVKTVIVPGRVASVPTPVVRGPRLAFVERDELGVARVVFVDVEAVGTRP